MRSILWNKIISLKIFLILTLILLYQTLIGVISESYCTSNMIIWQTWKSYSWSPYHSSTQPFATQNLETNSKGIRNFRIMLQYLLEDERLQNSTSAEKRLKENIYWEQWRLQMSERDKTIKQPINQSINLKNVILLQIIKLFDWLIDWLF